MELESLVQYLDELLDISGFPDHPHALNGLQVGGAADVARIASAVDASVETARRAVELEADLLLVHHGLFWEGLRPVTGRTLQRLRTLLEGGVAVYSAHLPLDAHPDVGNCILVARALALRVEGGFGAYEGRQIGFWGTTETSADGLRDQVAAVVQGPVRLIAGGPDTVRSVAVVTGGGGSYIPEAAARGVDALVTGEGSHHTYIDAMELGVNVYYAGHYATETFGVRALADHVADRFGLPGHFIDAPSGL